MARIRKFTKQQVQELMVSVDFPRHLKTMHKQWCGQQHTYQYDQFGCTRWREYICERAVGHYGPHVGYAYLRGHFNRVEVGRWLCGGPLMTRNDLLARRRRVKV
jgi:hypothetical protein